MMKNTYLRIDIVSDVVCPWCAIGYMRLMQALRAFPDQFDIHIVWHPFELNPQMPDSGENLRAHIASKYGTTPEASITNQKELTQLGSDVGFTFNFFDDMRMVNTRKAHQLLHWIDEGPAQTQLYLRLFADYFTNKKDINEIEVLLQAAESVGMAREDAATALQDTANIRQTMALEEQILAQGIQGVPLFMFNHSYAISGAQEVGTFIQQLQQIIDEQT